MSEPRFRMECVKDARAVLKKAERRERWHAFLGYPAQWVPAFIAVVALVVAVVR